MEHLLWPGTEPGPFCVLILAELPRNPFQVGTVISSILQLGKLRLTEVKLLFKQAATGPYSASCGLQNDTLPLVDKVPG